MAMLPVQAPSEQEPVRKIRPRLTGSSHRGLASPSDERLVGIARDGDEGGCEILSERHSAAILRYCRSLLRSTQEAEDVKQEVFVIAISALRRGAEPDAFRPWLYRIAHNACMSHLRMRRPVLVADNGVLVGPLAAAEPVDGHREELRQLLDDIGRLPDVQRGALLLREMDGFSYEQVGEVLGLPLSTVRASIFRARRTLQGLAEARDADCETIQSELAELADRRGRRGRHITSHLTVCSSCRDFRAGLRRRRTVLGGIAPAGPIAPGALLALKGKLFGGLAAGGSGAAIATAGGGAGVAKIAAGAASSIALLAGRGVEAARAIEHARRPVATHPAAAPAAGARSGAHTAGAGIAAAGRASSPAGGPARTAPAADRVAAHRSGGAPSSSSSSSRADARAKHGAGGTTARRPRAGSAPRSAPAATATAAPRSAAPDTRQGTGTGTGTGGREAQHSGGFAHPDRGDGRDHGRGGGTPAGTDHGGRSSEREDAGDRPTPRLEEPREQSSAGGRGDEHAVPARRTRGSHGGAPVPPSSSPSPPDGTTSSPAPAPQPADGSVSTDSSGTPVPAPSPQPDPQPQPQPDPAPTPDPSPAPAPDASPAGDAGTAGTAATTPVDPGAGA